MTMLEPEMLLDLIEKTHGKLFIVRFFKKDGSRRQLVGRIDVTKDVKHTHHVNDPLARGAKPVWDSCARGWRSVPLDRTYYFRCGPLNEHGDAGER